MKKTLGSAVIGLLACALSASAIDIRILEDTDTRLDFTVEWSVLRVADSASTLGLQHWIFATDFESSDAVAFDFGPASSGLLAGSPGGFEYYFHLGTSRLYSTIIPQGGNDLPDFTYPVPGNDYAARFIYGADISTGVPDGGSTLLLLAGALGTLGWFNRRFSIVPLPVRPSPWARRKTK